MRNYGISRVLGATASIVLLAACSGNGQRPPIGVPNAAGQSLYARTPNSAGPIRSETPPKSVLYVSAESGAYIRVYDQAGKNQSPIRTITNGLSNPMGMTVTPNGDLWVADAAVQGVLVFRRGASTAFKTLSDPGQSPDDVAVDKKGTAYVFNMTSSSISVYLKGNTLPTSTLSIPDSIQVTFGAFDSAGNLYVDYWTSGGSADIAEFVGGKPPEIDIHATSLTRPYGIAFDNTGDALVADSYVVFFDLPNNTPEFNFNSGYPNSICFSSDFKHMFVVDVAAPAVLKYTYPAGQLVDKISKGLIGNGHEDIVGIAADPPAQP